MGLRAMGVDVSLRRGHDAVLLDGAGEVIAGPVTVSTGGIGDVIDAWRPDTIAIDSPPAWGVSGESRPLERKLARLGISIFPTPSDPRGRPMFDWMREGMSVFESARERGFVLYMGRRRGRHSLEVFPHASAVALLGALPPRGSSRREARTAALRAAGVDCSSLVTHDHLDAALAAVTGVRFLQGRSCAVGDRDAVLVLPVPGVPERYRRSHSL